MGHHDGHHHHTDDACRSERGEQSGGQQHAGPHLGDCSDAGLGGRPLHADRGEPAHRALDPALAEHLVVAVVGEEQAEDHAQYEHSEVELGHVATVVGEAVRATGEWVGNPGGSRVVPC